MPAMKDLWPRQHYHALIEASYWYEKFRKAEEPNIDDLDRAQEIYEGCCFAYDLKHITFEEFVEFGKSLRARQAFP